jgi:hypothetical protein
MSPPDMRSRLLALTAVAFLGSTPIGGPITGWVADAYGASWSLAYGGVIACGCAVLAAVVLRGGWADQATPGHDAARPTSRDGLAIAAD